ncbi:MAG: hypothetical protein JW974_03220 [Alphaproteobacteria bacterium]|nr:hypothetical protein [Alphaproteobacteria bacterium]MBN2674894.1 hypothetical protein [Alphaproteobacteria bacterium]
MDEFKNDSKFSKSAVVNGGEATTPYFYNSMDYIPILNSELLNRNFEIEFHTNSVWAKSKKADIIWQDLKILADDVNNKHILDLSCDQYHKNLDGLHESFKVLSSPDFINKNLITKLLSFEGDPVIEKIQSEIKQKYPNLKIESKIDNQIIKTGEAAKNNIGIEVPFFEYGNEYRAMRYIWTDNSIAIGLHPDRTASIGTFYNEKRRVSYVNKDGTLKPWKQLYPQLVEKYINCFKEDKCNLFTQDELKRFLIPENHR